MHLTSTQTPPQPRPAARDFVHAHRFALKKTPTKHPFFGRIDDNNNSNSNSNSNCNCNNNIAAAATPGLRGRQVIRGKHNSRHR
jgi:hypothetical protein